MRLPAPSLSAVVLIAFRRRAAFSPVRRLKSPVMRRYWWLPSVRSTWCVSIRRGGLLTWLTAPPVGAGAEQKGGRAAQQFQPVQVEGVTVVERGVAHAVNEHVPGALQGKAAQPD